MSAPAVLHNVNRDLCGIFPNGEPQLRSDNPFQPRQFVGTQPTVQNSQLK